MLRFQATGGGGAPTANDHARLAHDVAREAGWLGAQSVIVGGGQLCFRGGEISESAESDEEEEAGPGLKPLGGWRLTSEPRVGNNALNNVLRDL